MAEIQVELISADPDTFEISDDAANLSLPTSTTKEQLNSLVRSLLQDPEDDNVPQEFAFLINSQLFQSKTVAQHALLHQFSTEQVVSIHFFVDVAAPEPDMEYPHDDWISDLHIGQQYILSSSYSGVVTLWSRDEDNYDESGSDDEISGSGEQHIRPNKDLSFSAHSSAVKRVSWLDAPDSNNNIGFVTSSNDQTSIIWRVDQRKIKKADRSGIRAKPMYKLKGHTESVDALAVRSGKILTGGYDRMLKIWDGSMEEIEEEEVPEKRGPGQKGKPRTPLMTISGHSEAVTDVNFDIASSDKFFSTSLDHTIREWDFEIAKELSRITSAKAVLAITNSDSLIATGSTDRFVRLYDKKAKQSVKTTLQFHTGWVSSVKFNPNNANQLVSGSFDGLAVLWDIRSNKTPLYQMDAHKNKVFCVDWSEDNKIASGSADRMLITYSAMSKLKSDKNVD